MTRRFTATVIAGFALLGLAVAPALADTVGPTSQPEAGKPLALTDTDSGKPFTIRVGQTVRVTLIGWGWQDTSEGSLLVKAPVRNAPGGQTTLRFEAVRAGRMELKLSKPSPRGGGILGSFTAKLTVEGPAGASTQPAGDGKQGVQGKLTVNYVNKMPGPGAMPRQPGPAPTAAEICVFRGKFGNGQDDFWFANQKGAPSEWVVSVKSDAAGQFRIALPPGVYTFGASFSGRVKLPRDEAGHPRSVTVEAGKWVTFNVAITEVVQ